MRDLLVHIQRAMKKVNDILKFCKGGHIAGVTGT